jgi:hypothetical protein
MSGEDAWKAFRGSARKRYHTLVTRPAASLYGQPVTLAPCFTAGHTYPPCPPRGDRLRSARTSPWTRFHTMLAPNELR